MPVTDVMPGRARSCAALRPGAFPSKATLGLVGCLSPTIDLVGRRIATARSKAIGMPNGLLPSEAMDNQTFSIG